MKLTKTVLKQIIREEIRLINEQYFKTKQLKPGMMVMHKDWDPRTSEPMKVVKIKGNIMLRLKGQEDTEPTAGGESDNGWYEV